MKNVIPSGVKRRDDRFVSGHTTGGNGLPIVTLGLSFLKKQQLWQRIWSGPMPAVETSVKKKKYIVD